MEKEIENYLNQNYLMIRKGRFYYLLGGAVVMIIAILGLSIQTVKQTVKKTISGLEIIKIEKEMKEMREQSLSDYTEISQILNKIKDDKRLFSTGTVSAKEVGEGKAIITVPSNTTTDDWDLFLIPNKIGNLRKGEKNDALLLYDTKITKKDKRRWVVDVFHYYRYDSGIQRESWGATYILLSKVFRSDE